MEFKSYFTEAEAAAFCNVIQYVVSGWIRTGKIQAKRVPGARDYRISRESLRVFLQSTGKPTHELDVEEGATIFLFPGVADADVESQAS